MISVGTRDARKGMELGFAGRIEMEDTELEEGEACSSHINEYDSNIDVDVALSYIDDKIQDVLGHFQKEFEGGVSAENLGAKWGGYGSFLPSYQRSPVSSHPKTPQKVQNCSLLKSPNNLKLEAGQRNNAVCYNTPQSVGVGPASTGSTSLVAPKAPSANDPVKQEGSVSLIQADQYAPRHESANKKDINSLDQKTLKVRLKVGSDNLSTRKNAIYSGLGLDATSSSSVDDSPSESEGISHEPQDAPFESPTCILQIMTSFPVHEDMMSPLHDDLIYLIEKEKLLKEGRVNGNHTMEGGGKVSGSRKTKLVERNDLSAESKSGKNKDGTGLLSKKEHDIDMFACEELVSKTLKLPLLSSSFSTVNDVIKSKEMDKKTLVRDKVFPGQAEDEPMEPISTQEDGWVEKRKANLAGKVQEDRKVNVSEDVLVHPKKEGHCRVEKTYELVKGDLNVSKGRKSLNTEVMDHSKQKVNQKATSHEVDDTRLISGKEYPVPGEKNKPKESHRTTVAEFPKESSRVGSSSAPKMKGTHANSSNIDQSRDTYRDLFGDIDEKNQMNLSELPVEDKLKDSDAVAKSTSAVNSASRERQSGNKFEKPSITDSYPMTASNIAPHSGNGPVSAVPPATGAPAPIADNWVCCDKCLKWRLLPYGTNLESLPEKWLCSMLNWLPGMNRCNVNEEETTEKTKALIAQYQVPAPESQNNLPRNPGLLEGVALPKPRNPDQNLENFGLPAMPSGGKKKIGAKELPNATNKDGSIQFPNSMKKTMQASVKSRSLNDVNQSPLPSEPDLQQLSKSSDMAVEKRKHKYREKHRDLERSTGGGDIKNLKIKNRRDSDPDSSRASKKIKTEVKHINDEEWASDYSGAVGEVGISSSGGFLTAAAGKDQIKNRSHAASITKAKDEAFLNSRSLDVGNIDSKGRSKKRKLKESSDSQIHMGSIPATGHYVEDHSIAVKEEFSENYRRKEKKARTSKSEGKESSASKGSGRTDKKISHTKNQQHRKDISSSLTHRSRNDVDSLKKDLGSVQVPMAATSSSSKISGSQKTKSSFQEVKGSPVESVSSSPMRILNPDKLTSVRRDLMGKDESQNAGHFAIGSPRRCSDGEDDGGSDRSATARKDKVSTVAYHGARESSVLDFQDRENGKHYHSNGSHPRKSGKGYSSSLSKDKKRSFESDLDIGEAKNSNVLSEQKDHSPSHGIKPEDGKNKLQEKFGSKSGETENKYVSKKDVTGKSSIESSKREGQSNFGGHDGPDVKPETICKKDAISTPKQNSLQDCDGEKSSKIPSEKTERVDAGSVRGKSLPLPPSGGFQNEITGRCPRPAVGSQKGNGADSSQVDASEGNDALKQMQTRRVDNQNGAKHISSRHLAQNGHRARDIDAPSPVRRDSGSQAGTNALKEAKDLKHLADRVKNAGSSESTGLYFQAAVKFIHAASLLENTDSAKHIDMTQCMQMYSSTAKLCEFCAHEYEKAKDMAAAALAYKCMEVAYMRVIYSSHASASRDRLELQTALQLVPPLKPVAEPSFVSYKVADSKSLSLPLLVISLHASHSDSSIRRPPIPTPMTLMTPPPLDQQQQQPPPPPQEDDEMLVPHSDLPNGPQPMEEAQAETNSAVDAPVVDDPLSARFTWTIDRLTMLNTKKLYSDVFLVGGYKWRILIFPKGNNVDHLSMYLDVADSGNLPYGWSRYAQFSLSIVNQIHSKHSIRKETQHQFNARESDWGFTSFMPVGELYDPARGYIVNDTCIVEADVAVRKVIDYWSHDSKKETGSVGLKNQGATCYMNSLLQTLYHIPYFRKAVYHMPTTENDNPSGSIPLALQSLFYKLQYNDTSVATKELTKSFGWDAYDSFMQHDVQELNRVLSEKLEDKMKGTVVEGTIQQLFEGHQMNYIECINVDYKSTRKESFYDLQLDVKGCRDVYASFDKYVEVERLEGDNKYHAEQYGLQDAKKGVLFIDFPPVLQLQLKRFEYDFMRDTMVKINDRYEFPLQLDLDRENGKYLSPDADRSVRNLYTLHSVLVHSGGVHGGHYYAYIRPTLSDQWFKFDDERVTKEDMKRALEEQYGGEEELPQTNPGFNNAPFKFTKYSNAYMLVYIREVDKEKIICNVDEKDIAEHLRIRLKKEQEEKEQKRKEKAEAHLYTIIKVARNEDLFEQIGKNIYFDLVDHDKVHSFRIQKQMPFKLFKEEVAKEFGIPVQFQRFWLWAKRQNHTYRPNRPLTPLEEAQSVGQLREVSNKSNNAELKLFLEIELGLDLLPLSPPEKTKEEILLFFKFYDPFKEELRYVGRLFVKGSGKPVELLTKLHEMAGLSPDEKIELFEEIKFEPNIMCEHIDERATFRVSQLEDGDIICFQKSPQSGSSQQFRYPDVPSFLDYVRNRQVVRFRSLDKPKEDEFCLELSKFHTYDDVVERVAQHLGLDDPTKVRLTSHNCYSQQPKPQPIKYRGVEHLSDMLVHYNQTTDILYYEVLDIPLPELQGLKTLKVAFHHATKDEVVIHTIRLPKQSTVGDVIDDLKTKVELSHPNAELRLLEVFYHKIYKIFPPNEKIENINDQYWTLRAEEIPEEEKNFGPHDRLIHVYHFMKDTAQNQVQNFGEPFFLVIREDETLAEVKVRVQKKLQVPDEEYSKWNFAFLSMGRPEYLQDDDIVASRFQRRDVYGAWEQYLGLEHTDHAPKRSHTTNQNRHTFEKPVKIYN